MKQGIITGFKGSWGSGLAYLYIDGEPIPCDNGPTVRALEDAFSDVIAPDHVANTRAFVGQRIMYDTDSIGVLEWFAPAPPEEGE